ncbi:hypothetical protein [Paenibacillus sp. SYP-B3998]|uniref:hypothetical protein n=1 Tax=Paenibacillus sp. SYP-B3998 TaxID=2678564 RepID=UPI001967AEA7|nr:hypothetical protein [Paenibacillus sp. SYP-B3998]
MSDEKPENNNDSFTPKSGALRPVEGFFDVRNNNGSVHASLEGVPKLISVSDSIPLTTISNQEPVNPNDEQVIDGNNQDIEGVQIHIEYPPYNPGDRIEIFWRGPVMTEEEYKAHREWIKNGCTRNTTSISGAPSIGAPISDEKPNYREGYDPIADQFSTLRVQFDTKNTDGSIHAYIEGGPASLFNGRDSISITNTFNGITLTATPQEVVDDPQSTPGTQADLVVTPAKPIDTQNGLYTANYTVIFDAVPRVTP